MAKIILNVELNKGNASEQLKQLQAELQQIAKTASQVGGSGSADAKIKQVESLRKSASNLLSTIENIRKQFTIKKGDTSLDEYEAQLKKIRDTTKEYSDILNDANSKGLNKEQVTNVKKLSDEMATLAANVAQYRTENDKVARANPFDRDFTSQIQSVIKGYQNLEAHIKSVEKYYAKGTFDSQLATIKQNETALYELQNTYGGTGKMTAEANAKLTEYQKTLGDVTNATKKAELENTNYHGSLQDIVSGFLKFQVAAMLVMKPLQALQKAWASLNETLVETEDAVIAIQRVISENLTNSEVANDLYKLAQEYGQTFDNVSKIATNFVRQGLSWTEAIVATKAALIALNVAELDATDASEGLIAIMTQFGYEASDLAYVIDVLNKAADNAAVTTEKLLTALQKTGSYAKSANLSFEDTVAIITALSESTAASGQNIGNALKSLLSYTTQDSALSTFASLSDEMNTVVEQYKRGGATILDVWKQLSIEMQSLSSEQADLLESWSGDLDDELSGELSEVYDTMKGIYDTAGTYRKNYFIALMSNMDGVLEAQQTISDAAGYSQKENETYLESYTAKLNALQAKWEELANDEQGLLGIKKLFVDIGSAILDVVEWTGGLRTTFIALGTVIAYAFGPTIVTQISAFFNVLKAGLTASASAATKLQAALGWIGLICVAVSTLIGVIQEAVSSAKEAAEEARAQAIATYEANADNEKELNKLLKQYEKLTPADEDFYDIEQKLVKLLSTEKQNALSSLTEKTDEYTEAVKNLTEAQQNQYQIERDEAIKAAEENVKTLDIGSGIRNETGGTRITDKDQIAIYQELGAEYGGGYHYYSHWEKDENGWPQKIIDTIWDYIFLQFSKDDNLETQLANYDKLVEWQTKVADLYNEAVLSGDEERQEALLAVYSQITTEIDAVKETVEKYRELVDVTDDVTDNTDDANKKTEEWANSLDKVSEKVETLLEYIQNMRDAEEASNKLAEKRQAILDAEIELEERKADLIEKQNDLIKAQQELENAKNERSIRVFNAATNQWEWQANNEDIEKAQENVDSAKEAVADAKQAITDAEQDIIDALKDLEENGWDEIENLLESGNVTNAKMLEILDKYKDYLPEWVDEVKNLVKEQTGVDLDEPATDNSATNSDSGTDNGNGTSTSSASSSSGGSIGGGGGRYVETFKAYDSGGILSGLGGIKATKEDEIVLPPELTRKILTPTSNEQFRAFAQSLGLMFGASKNTPFGDGGIVRNQNTTNNSDSRSYTINGVPIAKEQAERYTIAELCEAMDLVN